MVEILVVLVVPPLKAVSPHIGFFFWRSVLKEIEATNQKVHPKKEQII